MGQGAWCRCAQCTPRAVRRQWEGEGDGDGKGREGAIDSDSKGAHPCTPGSEGEMAGGQERAREGRGLV